MAELRTMPALQIEPATFGQFGEEWLRSGTLSKKSGMDLSSAFNDVIAQPLAEFLGGIPIYPGRRNRIAPSRPVEAGAKGAQAGARQKLPPAPPDPDFVESGDVLVIGGIRPQYFDVGYRPDGVRFVADIKTLNNKNSVGQNYANMINDLTAESTTIHTRFPYAVVAFLVVVPRPCLEQTQTQGLLRRLEGLARRDTVDGAPQLAEAISFIVWDPATGHIDPDLPPQGSPLRVESFSSRIERMYIERYAGSPPHLPAGARIRTEPETEAEPQAVEATEDQSEAVEPRPAAEATARARPARVRPREAMSE